jgi:hypothetical protein
MWKQILSVISNFRKPPKDEQEMEETTCYARRVEGDWLAEDPNSWYYGPLEFFTQTEERVEEESEEKTETT